MRMPVWVVVVELLATVAIIVAGFVAAVRGKFSVVLPLIVLTYVFVGRCRDARPLFVRAFDATRWRWMLARDPEYILAGAISYVGAHSGCVCLWPTCPRCAPILVLLDARREVRRAQHARLLTSATEAHR